MEEHQVVPDVLDAAPAHVLRVFILIIYFTLKINLDSKKPVGTGHDVMIGPSPSILVERQRVHIYLLIFIIHIV